jgi:hypothetical protein
VQPWWFLVAFIPIIGIFLIRRGFMMKRLHEQVQRGDKKWDDDWDPFS